MAFPGLTQKAPRVRQDLTGHILWREPAAYCVNWYGGAARAFVRDGLRYLGKERARSSGTDAELEWIWSGRYHLKLSSKGGSLDSLVEAAGRLDARTF